MKFVPRTPPKIPFTQTAFEEMRQNQARLTQELKEVMARLKVAREMGDLSENGAYKYAKFEIGSIRRQLSKLNYLIKNGEILAPNTNTKIVGFGSLVTVASNTTAQPLKFRIVSTHEADPLEGKLSVDSPIGVALMNKKVGDTVEVQTPKAKINYTLLKIA